MWGFRPKSAAGLGLGTTEINSDPLVGAYKGPRLNRPHFPLKLRDDFGPHFGCLESRFLLAPQRMDNENG